MTSMVAISRRPPAGRACPSARRCRRSGRRVGPGEYADLAGGLGLTASMLRTDLDVPVDVLSGVPGSSPDLFCSLLGSITALPAERLAEPYGSRVDYEQRYRAAQARVRCPLRGPGCPCGHRGLHCLHDRERAHGQGTALQAPRAGSRWRGDPDHLRRPAASQAGGGRSSPQTVSRQPSPAARATAWRGSARRGDGPRGAGQPGLTRVSRHRRAGEATRP